MFDIKYLLETEGFTQEVKEGFKLYLLWSDRPINEVIVPNFQDQRAAMVNQFAGMTDEVFAYEEYQRVRARLVQTLHENLTENDKAFLLSVKNVAPDWSIYDFERFPAVRWKLQNLQILKDKNPDRHHMLFETLEKKLNGVTQIEPP